MVHHKNPNNFYVIKPPLRIWYNWKGKCWRLLDTHDVIIADNLTKELAETLMQAVNYCGSAINFTKLFVEYEHVVNDREDALHEDIKYRNKMYNHALMFLVELGLMAPPDKYKDMFPIWRDQLMENFYKKAADKWL